MALRAFTRWRGVGKPRLGFSLLEMIAATALVASTIVPALSIMRGAMANSRDMNRRNLLANYAVQVLEERVPLVAMTWDTTTASGDFTADGHANIRYTVTSSDAVVDGGLVDRLMHLQSMVYDDANGNSSADTNELQISFRTKIAKLVTYENEPN